MKLEIELILSEDLKTLNIKIPLNDLSLVLQAVNKKF